MIIVITNDGFNRMLSSDSDSVVAAFRQLNNVILDPFDKAVATTVKRYLSHSIQLFNPQRYSISSSGTDSLANNLLELHELEKEARLHIVGASTITRSRS